LPFTNKGFTGHESIQEVGLIHMNGRVYDAVLARFISADPHIQAGSLSQSYNRYSYVMNNPLKYTDPTGYFFKKLFKKIKKAVKAIGKIPNKIRKAKLRLENKILRAIAKVPILNAVAQAAACYFGGPAGCAAYASRSSYAVTGSLNSALKAGLRAYITSSISNGIKGHYGNSYNIERVFVQSVAGGASSVIQGGKFGEGFKSSLLISSLTYGNFKMRESRIQQLRNSGSDRNLNGISKGMFGDNLKLAGAGEVIGPDGRLPCTSLMGGCQGAPVYINGVTVDERSSFFGTEYDPGDLRDTINESFAGPHDWFRNATGSYITNPVGAEILGNGKYLTGWADKFDAFKNYALIVPAAPFGVAGLVDKYDIR
jgi:RHS repeat-associated protein